MAKKKLSQITSGTAISSADKAVMVHDNGDGTYTDYITPLKKRITVGSTGTTLTDAFFSNTIEEIVMDNQVYLSTTDFTQSGTTITGVTISFTSGSIILAKL